MTEHAPERIWSNIDIPKTLAGVLAAVSAAVIGSFLGVAGTLAGAAIASLVGSVGTELYKRWIDRGSQKIKSTFVPASAAVGTPPVRAAHSAASQLDAPGVYRASASIPVPAASAAVPPSALPRQFRWRRAIAVAAAFFVLAVALLTVFELVTHRSIADAVGSGSGKSTTIGSVLTGHDRRETPPVTPTPSDSPSPSPTQSTEPSQGGQPTTDAPGTQAPTTAPPTQGTDPTQGPTGQSGTGQGGTGSQGGTGQGGTGFQGENGGQGGARFRGGTTATPDQE